MIFVTVGTHEQPFNRLLKFVDGLKQKDIITENVIMQTGFSTYEPHSCIHERMFSYSEMEKYIKEARIVITHGGPSSFMMPLQIGKIPIIVPRQKKYGEHVNDHQLIFAKRLEDYQNNIIVVYEIEMLEDIILRYDEIIKLMPKEIKSNEEQFVRKFVKIVSELEGNNKKDGVHSNI